MTTKNKTKKKYTTKGPKKTAYDVITEELISIIETKNILPWQKPWQGANGIQKNAISGKPYKGINQVITYCADFPSNYWVTFKQAKDLKGSVKKGEKSRPIVFWKSFTKKNKEGEEEDFFTLQYYRVFNVDQCEGLELPKAIQSELSANKIVLKDNEKIEKAEAIIKNYRGRPTLNLDSDAAYYIPALDQVHMPKIERFKDSESFYCTLFHELGHSTGHESRLNRPLLGLHRNRESYSKEELIAEFTACFLASECHLKVPVDNSAAYLKSWLKVLKGSPKMLIEASGKARKAANHILGVE